MGHPYKIASKELKDVILLRHKSSHLKFRLEGVLENELSGWTEAGLFTKYFKQSRGNIGFALQEWLSNIIGVNKSEIDIKMPGEVDTDVLDRLPDQWVNLFQQFILHKRMLPSKFARLAGLNKAESEHLIKAMVRSKVIVEQNGTLEINRYFLPYLIKNFEDRRYTLWNPKKGQTIVENEMSSDKN